MRESNDIFAKILKHGPSQGTLFLILDKMKKEGRAREVIQECLNALNIYPDDIKLRELLAECYLEVGFIGSAQKELEVVTSHIDSVISVYKLHAENAAQQDRPEEALKSIKVYLAHKQDDQEALGFMRRMESRLEKSATGAPVSSDSVDKEKDKKEHGILDLATPTLAEIYYKQGLINEAIQTYEKILEKNPDDSKASIRIKELKAALSKESSVMPVDEETIKARKKKMIGILEGWLQKIQE